MKFLKDMVTLSTKNSRGFSSGIGVLPSCFRVMLIHPPVIYLRRSWGAHASPILKEDPSRISPLAFFTLDNLCFSECSYLNYCLVVYW